MEARGWGVIVNVFDAVPVGAGADHLPGVTGSSAVETLTRVLGGPGRATGVRVVGVGVPPGTDSTSAEAVADVVIFLASDRASMVSGTVLAVDGGAGGR